MSADAMTNESSDRIQLLQGTLDMLILRTLLFGPAHGHEIAKHIQRTTDDLLQIEHGSLYPALHRLERKGWVAAKWETAGKDLKREFKYYRLTPLERSNSCRKSRNGKNDERNRGNHVASRRGDLEMRWWARAIPQKRISTVSYERTLNSRPKNGRDRRPFGFLLVTAVIGGIYSGVPSGAVRSNCSSAR